MPARYVLLGGSATPRLPKFMERLADSEEDRARSEALATYGDLEFMQDGKLTRGKDGWLFIAHDNNRTMAQQSGELRFTEQQLRQWQWVLENRFAWVEKRGAQYFFFASPEAHSIYPEKLPEDVRPAAERPIHQLIGHLEQNRSFARIIYPVDEVAEHKQRPVFPKTDSHWTDLGAFAGYRKLVGELASELGTIHALTFDDVVEWEEERPGDLGLKMRPVQTSPFVFLDVREPQARLTYDNRVASSGRRVEYECDAGERVCLIFGTSFTLHTLPFLAESFRRLVYVHLRTLDHSLVARERPDVVIGMSAERVMIQVPNDLTASTFEEVEAMKRARGTVMPPSKRKGNRLNYPG